MISLSEKLDQAFKKAIKGQQQTVLSTLRMLKTAVRHKEVEVKHPLSDAELLAVINSQAKQRRDSIAEFSKAGRRDLASKEEEELQVLLSFFARATEPRGGGGGHRPHHRPIGSQHPQKLGEGNENRHG